MERVSKMLMDRDLIQHHTFEKTEWLDEPKTFYLGVDCSADSLTVGNLMTLLVARRLLEHGWKAVLLVGGATTLIGDPGGKDQERALKSREEIQTNVQAIRKQIQSLFAGKEFTLVDNYDWFRDIRYLDFLRDVGKHFSMTELVQREYVRERMGEGGTGISYAEFSYSLIQGYDFWYLFKNLGVDLQIGGSDQWGNMISGVPLIRKKEGKEAHALSVPLLINKTTGKKFGKSEDGAVWLDARRTSPFRFYQFWYNSEDEAVKEYMLKMTLLPIPEIEEVMAHHEKNPGTRVAQSLLARHVTTLVHGAAAADAAASVSQILFGQGNIESLSDIERTMLFENAPHCAVDNGSSIVDVLVAAGLASSRREAKQFVLDGAVSLSDIVVLDTAYTFKDSDFANGLVLLRRGKRNVCVLTATGIQHVDTPATT